jgi:aminoglycoside/choline kinase family phosphotransferase
MEFGQRLPVRTPKMYYGDFDRDAASEKQEEIMQAANRLPGFLMNPMTTLARWIAGRKKRRYILLLEDITHAESGNQVAGADVARCAEALRMIARAHAAFWADPELTRQFWLLPLNIDTRMRHGMFRKSTPAFIQMFQTEMNEGLAAYMRTVEQQGLAMMDTLCAAPATLLHCDLRLDNLFFRDHEVIVFDWQLVRRGPAAYDVAYFLSGALDEHAEAEDVDRLLATYHEALGASGVTDYALAELRRDYRLALHNVLQSLATIDQMDLGDGRGIPLMRSWIRRLHARLRVADAMSID